MSNKQIAIANHRISPEMILLERHNFTKRSNWFGPIRLYQNNFNEANPSIRSTWPGQVRQLKLSKQLCWNFQIWPFEIRSSNGF